MADRGDDRNFGYKNRPRDNFFVKRPEIFQRSAAAAGDDDIDGAKTIKITNRLGDFPRRAIALHFDWTDDDAPIRITIANDAQHIVQRRALIGSDDADRMR